VYLHVSLIDEQLVERFHGNGQQVGVYFKAGEESPEFWENAINLKVDMICTDAPKELLKFIEGEA
jgi:glycerophosphoryl diester phosphodiesterase